MSKHQIQLGRVRWASRRGEGKPNPPRATKTSGANGGRNWRTQVYVQNLTIKRKYLPEKRSAGGERDGAQHDGKRATTVTELAERNSSSLPIRCGRWQWMESTAWAERRAPAFTRRWAATSSVCRKLGVAASLLFSKMDMLFTAAGESGGDGG